MTPSAHAGGGFYVGLALALALVAPFWALSVLLLVLVT